MPAIIIILLLLHRGNTRIFFFIPRVIIYFIPASCVYALLFIPRAYKHVPWERDRPADKKTVRVPTGADATARACNQYDVYNAILYFLLLSRRVRARAFDGPRTCACVTRSSYAHSRARNVQDVPPTLSVRTIINVVFFFFNLLRFFFAFVQSRYDIRPAAVRRHARKRRRTSPHLGTSSQ